MNQKLRFLIKTANVYIHYKIKRYIPFALYLRISNRCNLKCKFCDFWKQKEDSDLDLVSISRVIYDAAKIGIPYLSVYGGEPLLREDLSKIGKLARRKGIVCALTTNGTLLNDSRVTDILNSFDIIKVSFAGLEEKHDGCVGYKGSFKKTIRGLNNLLKYPRKSQIIIHYLVNKENISDIAGFVKKFKNLVDSICFLPENGSESFFSTPQFIKQWKKMKAKYNIGDSDLFIEQQKIDRCDAGKLYFTIMPNGNVNACNVHQDLILGNIENQRFLDIYRNGINKEIQKRINNCTGCYMKCTTELSQIFQMPIYKIPLRLPRLVRTYKIL
jgi:MoaA/NifB/PqqE/SkfB family radical SAM enzyme